MKALQIAGAIIIFAGVLVLLGNVTGAYRTFPMAGFLTISLGSLMRRLSQSDKDV